MDTKDVQSTSTEGLIKKQLVSRFMSVSINNRIKIKLEFQVL